MKENERTQLRKKQIIQINARYSKLMWGKNNESQISLEDSPIKNQDILDHFPAYFRTQCIS